MSDRRSGFTGAGLQFLVAGACLVVIVAGLRAAAPLVLPFLVAVFLAVVSVPLIGQLQRWRVPRPLAVLGAVLLAVAAIGVLALVVGRSVNDFGAAAPRYQARLQALLDSGLALGGDLGLPIEDWSTLELVPFGSVFDLLGGTLGAITSFASNTFLVLLTVSFILIEAAGFSAKLREAFGEHVQFGQLEQMMRQVQRYLAIKSAVSAATGVLLGLWVAAFGLDFALLWGLVAFILNFIPTLGSIIAAVPAVLLAIVQFDLARAGLIALGYVGINVIFGNVVEPLLMGRRLGLSALVVFVSLVFWGWVWGPVGMLFSVPLTMSIKIALENTRDFRWVAVMLDANPRALRAAAARRG
ncbi:MAG: AI-2E family transporter [Acidobacteria bacterium]|nr:AI-2E family transporter [Acidobacteriota bacterium]MYI73812.1 AI-2E family transporter [Acidobacteriota bacterium]